MPFRRKAETSSGSKPTPTHQDMEKRVFVVGAPHFCQVVARALDIESEALAWVQSTPAAEEAMMDARAPVDVMVLSPELRLADALPMVEFIGRYFRALRS